MDFKVGDLVTRISHNNDIIFRITNIDNEICYLKGEFIRLSADSLLNDLVHYNDDDKEEKEFEERLYEDKLDLRDEYFYLPGKILHIDGDIDYLNKCLNYYKKINIWAKGILNKEEDISLNIKNYLEEYNPNIVVITGHDAFYKKDSTYKNSDNFIKAIKEARKYEKSHEKLIIIAGACQSNYEELIKAGANFASSPKRINIHALDPAIVASKLSLSSISEDINLKEILDKTKYGSKGMGGIVTKGTMHIGYPR